MSNIGPTEVSFEIKDGIEYATLHADTFRTAMRERDALREKLEIAEAKDQAMMTRLTHYCDLSDALRAEVERLKRYEADFKKLTWGTKSSTALAAADKPQPHTATILCEQCNCYHLDHAPERDALRADNKRLLETWVTLSEENERLRARIAELEGRPLTEQEQLERYGRLID